MKSLRKKTEYTRDTYLQESEVRLGQLGAQACKLAWFLAKIDAIVPIDFCMFEAVYIKNEIYEHYIYIDQPAFCVFEAIFDDLSLNLYKIERDLKFLCLAQLPVCSYTHLPHMHACACMGVTPTPLPPQKISRTNSYYEPRYGTLCTWMQNPICIQCKVNANT